MHLWKLVLTLTVVLLAYCCRRFPYYSKGTLLSSTLARTPVQDTNMALPYIVVVGGSYVGE